MICYVLSKESMYLCSSQIGLSRLSSLCTEPRQLPTALHLRKHKSPHLFRPESMIRDVWQGFLSPPINGSALETRDTVLTYGYSCHSSSVWNMCQICEH
jgi:hypothetical protein